MINIKRIKNTLLVLAFIILNSSFCVLNAQVSINTSGSSPDNSAMLDVQSTDKGMLIPRMTTAQRTAIASPATGLLVFDETTGGFWFKETSGWIELRSGNIKELSDADNDTKIQVEKSLDQDLIHFDIAGTEYYRMQTGRIDVLNTGGSILIGQNAGVNDNLNNNANILIGTNSGQSIIDQVQNTAMGTSSLRTLNSGFGNSVYGHEAGQYLEVGSNNTFLGRLSGKGSANHTKSNNTFVGALSGNINEASNNTYIGTRSGQNNASGVGNLFIGYLSGQNALGSNQLYIDNSNTASPLLYGEFDNDLLRVNGILNINSAYSFPTTDGSSSQVLQTDGFGLVSWSSINTYGIFTNDGTIVRNSGDDTLDDFIFGSPSLDYNSNSNHASRLFFDKSKSSFRAGWSNNVRWDETNIGDFSFATGKNTEASGIYSFAAGFSSRATQAYAFACGDRTLAAGTTSFACGVISEANGSQSMAVGFNTRAQGESSLALGHNTQSLSDYGVSMGRVAISHGISSFALGYYVEALGDYSTAMGRYNVIDADHLFALGNGTSANDRQNSMHILASNNNAFFRGSVMPMLDNAVNLGSASNRWDNIWATNGTIQTSDMTLKTNVESLTYGLKDVMNIQTIRYNWKRDKDGKKKLGFNAQNLQQIIPEVVVDNEMIYDEQTGEMIVQKTDKLGVYYTDLIPVLTKAIQEQQKMIEENKITIKALHLRLSQLEGSIGKYGK